MARAVLCGEERATDLQNQKARFQAIKNRISSTQQAIAVFRNRAQDPPGSLVDSLTSLYEELEETSLRSPPSPRGRHQPSDTPRLHRSPRSPRSHANCQRHHTPKNSAAGPSGYLGRPSEHFASRHQVASFASFAQPAPSSEDGSPQRKKRRLSSGESSAGGEEVSTPSKSLHHSRDDEDHDPSHASSLGNMVAYIMTSSLQPPHLSLSRRPNHFRCWPLRAWQRSHRTTLLSSPGMRRFSRSVMSRNSGMKQESRTGNRGRQFSLLCPGSRGYPTSPLNGGN